MWLLAFGQRAFDLCRSRLGGTMLDKAVEQSRARTVSRRLSGILVDLGFEKQVSGKSVRVVDGLRWTPIFGRADKVEL